MALSDERDPRETIRLILDDNSTGADYANAGSKPTHIEPYEGSTQKIKQERSDDALYLWVAVDDDIDQQGATYDQFHETQVVQVEAWTKTSDTRANQLKRDVRSILFGYATDNRSSTAWNEIVPISGTDARHQARSSRRADHHIEALQVKLHANRIN